MNEVTFIFYQPEFADAFARLNLAWIEKYFKIEEADRKVLGDPQQYILDKGGYIFFALMDQEIVGCFALIKKEAGVFELAKMAVAESHQGKNIGNRMLEFCITKSKALGFHQLVLYTNDALKPAIHLYHKYGFKEVPVGNTEYLRSNVKMELDINSSL